MPTDVTNLRKLNKLLDLLPRGGELKIVLQNNPDPDALASAAGFKLLAQELSGTTSSVIFSGLIGRAENRAMLRYLGLSVSCAAPECFSPGDAVACLDTQPGAGNNCVPPDVTPKIIIDHHPLQDRARSSPFTDIRSNVGATSTIITQYLRLCDIAIDIRLATALLYGIKSDTQDLGRDVTQADIDAYLFLYPLANKRQLARIEREPVPAVYFQQLLRALTRAEVYGSKIVISSVGATDSPDAAAETADMLMRLEGIEWSLCVAFHNGVAYVSLRGARADSDSCDLIRKIVGDNGAGGGHDQCAGGQIPLRNKSNAEMTRRMKDIISRTCEALQIDPKDKLRLTSMQIVNGKAPSQ
ncbi:MAG TPA: DHH family phosphoesterase [Candidatus Brocadiia bacterium]|nr:DHH family phosphoesterase [Candidatus Brocadiia bacterium]